MAEVIRFEDVEREVRRLATENPDYVYEPLRIYSEDGVPVGEQCLYNKRGDVCACIFGQALTNLGYPVPLELEKITINRVIENMQIPSDYGDRYWAAVVQSNQDSGLPWGEAVARADDEPRVRGKESG